METEKKNFYKQSEQKRGYSLVEVLVAITVLLVALVGPLTIAQAGLKRAMNSREQTMAVFLAQESLETIVKLREDNALAVYPNFSDPNLAWGHLFALEDRCTASNPCGVTLGEDGSLDSSNFYRCNSTNCIMRYNENARVPYKQGVSGGEATAYRRTLTIDPNTGRMTATVTWGSRPDQRVELETYVYHIYYAPD